MHRAGWILVAAALAVGGACGSKAPDAPGPGSGSGPTAPRSAPGLFGPGSGRETPYVTPPPVPAEQLDKIGAVEAGREDLVAIAAGASVVSGPSADQQKQSPWFLLDEDPASPYAQLGTATAPPPLVIALSDEVLVDRVSVDYKRDSLADHIPERVQIAASQDGSAWTPIVDEELHLPPKDDVTLLAKHPVPGRFLRVTLVGSHATQSKDGLQELQELRVFGKRVTSEPAPSATGTYAITGVGTVHLTQHGATVTGCIDRPAKQTRIAGGFDGRVLRFLLTEPASSDSGPVVMTFGAGRAFYGFWSGGVEAHPFMTVFEGPKTGEQAGACPGDKAEAVTTDLAATGRARLFGVVFDLESDKIRDDAKPSLDRVVAVLKAQPELKLRIEAHTDASATPPHNQILSGKQTIAVRQYLVAAGIDARRLEMKAMGATAALAPNASPLGRAVNRRVEIVKL